MPDSLEAAQLALKNESSLNNSFNDDSYGNEAAGGGGGSENPCRNHSRPLGMILRARQGQR